MSVSKLWCWGAVAALLVGALETVPLRHLFEPDEARYAEVAREMLADGHWLVPHLNAQHYTQKPPFYMWMIALGRMARLPWTAAAVLPPLLALLAFAWLMPRFATQLGLARSQGSVAFALLVSSPLVAAMAMVARMDMLLCLVHTATLVFLARLTGLGCEPSSRKRSHLAFWALIGIGVLVKGPVALALPLVTVLVWRLLARPSISLKPVFVGWGPLLAVTVVLAWLVPAAFSAGTEYLEEIVLRQSAGRVVQSFAHRQPIYYHLVSYPFAALPWSPLVLLGLFRALRQRAADGVTFLTASVLAVLAFFTIVSGKIFIYLLPLFPAGALLAAETFGREQRGRRPALFVGSTGLLLIGVAIAAAPSLRDEFVAAPHAVTLAGIAVALVATVAGIAALAQTRAMPSLWPLVGAGLLFPALALPSLMLSADRAMSIHEIALTLRQAEPDQEDVLSLGVGSSGLNLYTERPIRELTGLEDLRSALAQGRAVVVSRSLWRRYSGALGKGVGVVIPFSHQREPAVVLRGVDPQGAAGVARTEPGFGLP